MKPPLLQAEKTLQMPKIEKDNEQCCLGGIAGNTDFSKTACKADFYKKNCRIAYFQSKTQKRLRLQRTANFALIAPAKHNVNFKTY